MRLVHDHFLDYINDPTRYQFQPWWVKLWRQRFLLLVPKRAFRIWWTNRKPRPCPGVEGHPRCMCGMKHIAIPFRNAWGIAQGLAHCRMNYTYGLYPATEIEESPKGMN